MKPYPQERWLKVLRNFSWFVRDTEARRTILSVTDDIFREVNGRKRTIPPTKATPRRLGLERKLRSSDPLERFVALRTWQAAQAWITIRNRCSAETVEALTSLGKLPALQHHRDIMEAILEVVVYGEKERIAQLRKAKRPSPKTEPKAARKAPKPPEESPEFRKKELSELEKLISWEIASFLGDTPEEGGRDGSDIGDIEEVFFRPRFFRPTEKSFPEEETNAEVLPAVPTEKNKVSPWRLPRRQRKKVLSSAKTTLLTEQQRRRKVFLEKKRRR